MAKDFFDEDLVEARSARTSSGAPSEAGGRATCRRDRFPI